MIQKLCLVLLWIVGASAMAEPKNTLATEVTRLAIDRVIDQLLDSIRAQIPELAAECDSATGDDAVQCKAFLERLKPETETMLAQERRVIESETADTAAEMASAISSLTHEDLLVIHKLLTSGADKPGPLPSPRSSKVMSEQMGKFARRLSPFDAALGDKFNNLVLKIGAEFAGPP